MKLNFMIWENFNPFLLIIDSGRNRQHRQNDTCSKACLCRCAYDSSAAYRSSKSSLSTTTTTKYWIIIKTRHQGERPTKPSSIVNDSSFIASTICVQFEDSTNFFKHFRFSDNVNLHNCSWWWSWVGLRQWNSSATKVSWRLFKVINSIFSFYYFSIGSWTTEIPANIPRPNLIPFTEPYVEGGSLNPNSRSHHHHHHATKHHSSSTGTASRKSRSSNSNAPKAFECTVCGKGLARKDKLTIHMRIHTVSCCRIDFALPYERFET